ncbi:MAG: hypothetical protein QOF78_1066 [Phycisphaerales bacterium]|nr:hypothetical protein [Phycisphaerales bacterium]
MNVKYFVTAAAWSFLLMPAVASAATVQAKPADAFVESLGVNTHYGNGIFTGGNAYADRRIDAKLAELGIRHIRDHSYNTEALGFVDNLNSSYGIRANLILGETTRSPADLVTLLKAHPAYEAIEGLNEPDFAGNRSYNGLTDSSGTNSYPATKAFQNDLYAAVKADPQLAGVTVLSPAMGRSNKSQYLSGINFDVAAMHSYAWASPTTFADKPSGGVDQALSDMSALRGSKPLWATESGYYNEPATNSKSVPEHISGKYTPRLYAEFFNRGIARSYVYELADQGPDKTVREQNFGLLRFDMTEKPAFTAMKRLIDLVEDPAAPPSFTPASLAYTLNGPASVHHTLLQKSDGRFFMMLWNEVLSYDSVGHVDLNVSDVAVAVALEGGAFDVRVFEPNASASPLSTYSNVTFLNLGVPDQMMVLELTRVPEPSAALLAMALAGASFLRRRSRSHR